MGFKDVYQCKSYTCLIVLFAARLSDFLIYVDKKMAQKNFFADLDPLSRLRNFEPQTRVMPQLYREDRGRMDDSYVETCQTKETDKQWRKDMHLYTSNVTTERRYNGRNEREIAVVRMKCNYYCRK